ncbi:hypothetical protein DRP04_12590 [Archaeoglobales archaeon]|nr:MAG: hypothetical protein DRP04_12590 [Archaeoglobales archaeon]
MNEVFNAIFTIFSRAGELVFERPSKAFYALPIVLSLISHITALLVLISILCYAYRRGRYAVLRAY